AGSTRRVYRVTLCTVRIKDRLAGGELAARRWGSFCVTIAVRRRLGAVGWLFRFGLAATCQRQRCTRHPGSHCLLHRSYSLFVVRVSVRWNGLKPTLRTAQPHSVHSVSAPPLSFT